MAGSVYNEVVRRVNGVDILGDPAQRVDAPLKYVDYVDKKYTQAEEVQFGLSGRQAIAAATSERLDAPSTDQPFLALRATIPSSVALYFVINFMQVSSVVLLEGNPICGDIFSEVSLNNGVRWPTVQTGTAYKMDFENTDPTDPHEPRFTLTGIRLR